MIWDINFGLIGGYLDRIGWGINEWLFFGLCGMSIITYIRKN